MNPLSAPFYLLPPLVVAFASIVLIILVLLAARRTVAAWIFCALLLSVGLTGLLIYGMRSSPNIQEALHWDKAATIVGLAIFVFYYHFTITYTQTRGQRYTLLAAYAVLLVVAALGPTDLVIQRMHMKSYGYAPVLGPVGFVVVTNALILMVAGAYNLLRRYMVSLSYDERNRLIYLVIGTMFPMTGGILDGLTNLPPASIWANLIFCILCSVAILKYHLLDIQVVIRKSLTYLLVSLVIAVPYVGVLYLLHYIFEPIMEPWWVHAILILLLAIILRPLYSWAQKLVDRLFYRDRYDYLKALEQFSQKTQSVVNLQELSSTLTVLVSGALHTSSAYLLLPSESANGFVVVSCIGLGSPPSGVVLKNNSLLIKWLKRQQRIVFSEEFNIAPQLQSMSLREKNNLEQMGAKLYVPIQTGPGQLSGILVLGQKLSEQPYSPEDRQLLTTMSSQMAISLENARLYDASRREVEERKQSEEREKELQKELYLSSRLAAIGELAAGVAHQINNPLTGILGFSQRLLRKSTDEEASQDLKRIYTEAERAAKIVQNLLTFARQREPKKEYSDINNVVQSALELRAYELKTSNIEVITELATTLPKIMLDSHQIQEVFLNIILNAEQAMAEATSGGKLIIKTKKNNRFIRITFTDDGPGIPAEHLDKLFDPFFTTKGERGGTGLGLSVCHGIITEHNGRIYAKSKLGKGTTFFVELPMASKTANKHLTDKK